ncbi:MAG: protein-L-isoaspartate O-methyltransferase [Gammaproteobacteria bacterium]|nr:protein-L-isoaspartate O-methyltransferase [Gammaproteobacteria bacterium]
MNIESARRQMVDQQIRAWDVLDERVLDAMLDVPREHFVPPAYRGLAFADIEIPIGHGEFMMAPKVEGRLLQALELTPADSVLEIGTGSGFLSGCISKLVKSVTSIDIRAVFTDHAGQSLRSAGFGNVVLETRDAMQLDRQRRFDAIAVTGSLPVYDERFQRALSPGGRLFVIAGSLPVMEALLVRRSGEDEWTTESLFETAIPPLVNARRPAGFIF